MPVKAVTAAPQLPPGDRDGELLFLLRELPEGSQYASFLSVPLGPGPGKCFLSEKIMSEHSVAGDNDVERFGKTLKNRCKNSNHKSPELGSLGEKCPHCQK